MREPERSPTGPADTVRNAVGSLRLMGSLFIGLGVLLVWLAVANGRPADLVGLLAASAVLLGGPGVLYHLTAVRVGRHDVTVALLARRTAVGQSVLAVAVVALLAVGHPSRRPLLDDVMVPAMATLFFVPALLAQAHQIGTALEALRQLPQAQRGFDVQPPMAVLPVEAEDDGRPVLPPPASAGRLRS